MKLSNFKDIKYVDADTLKERRFAEVDVTTGSLWWKKTERKTVTRGVFDYWCFVDSGEELPYEPIKSLARGHDAAKALMK